MQKLHFPTYSFKIRTQAQQDFIFDIIRKKFIRLTPEEWVRQHIVHFLIKERNYPKGLIAVEQGLKVNELARRFDVLLYNKMGKACFLIECKAAQVKITQDVFDQIARYNLALKVPYLLVTNGLMHYCCQIDFEQNNYQYLDDVPFYGELNTG